MKCDFCSSGTVTWRYPAKDVAMAPNHMSRGDWAACEECHRFIEAREMGQLADRSVRTFQERHGELPRSEVRALRRQLVGVHQQFLKARTGPAVSVP